MGTRYTFEGNAEPRALRKMKSEVRGERSVRPVSCSPTSRQKKKARARFGARLPSFHA